MRSILLVLILTGFARLCAQQVEWFKKMPPSYITSFFFNEHGLFIAEKDYKDRFSVVTRLDGKGNIHFFQTVNERVVSLLPAGEELYGTGTRLLNFNLEGDLKSQKYLTWQLQGYPEGNLTVHKSVLTGNALYSIYNGRYLFRHDLAANRLWMKKIDNLTNVDLAFSDNHIYLIDDKKDLTKFDTSGNEVWRTRLGISPLFLRTDSAGNSFVFGGVLMGPCVISKLDKHGKELWTLPYYDIAFFDATLYGDTLYACGGNAGQGMLLSVSAVNGELYEHHTIDLSQHIPITMWQDSLFYFTHIAVDKGAVYVGGYYNLERHNTFVARIGNWGPATAVTELQLNESGFGLFPNPCREVFNVTLPETAQEGKPVQITVSNNLGQQCRTEIIKNPALVQNYEIDLRNQPPGLYMVEVRTSNKKFVKKLVKQ